LGDRAAKEAGERLAKVLRVAMAQAGIETWYQLGAQSGVSPTTVDNWIYGVTTPRPHYLAKVAKRLHPFTSSGALERAYLGLEPEEPPLIEVLRDLAPDLHELVVLLRAQADQAVLAAVRTALEERRQRRGEGDATLLGELPPIDKPSDDDSDTRP
jgi:transcriptional regulator with XRE-family HTH domain